MSRKHTFIKGTFVLTLAGVISRIIGFIYRVFLSQTFGAEAMGIYQLIFPVFALCYAISTSGIENAIARCVAAKSALNQEEEAKQFLLSSMILSFSLSIVCTLLLQEYADFISRIFLQDTRTYELLLIISYAFPFASIHSCIIGYYFGLKKTNIPAITQLIEQITRVGSIIILYHLFTSNNIDCDISLAVIGLVLGEIGATIFTIYYATKRKQGLFQTSLSVSSIYRNLKELLPLSTPLTANRVILNLLTGIEAVSIPIQLQAFGYSSSEALTIYGVLIGMALPCILFPTALTSAASTLLLPTIAEIQALDNKKEIKQVVHKTTHYGTALGLTCLISFFIFSDFIGIKLFNTPEVGIYLRALAWLCPFLYLNTTLISIINGLGKPTITFFLNIIGLFIRIIGIFLFIPIFGIYAYLSALLISQTFITIGCYITFRKLCIT